MAKFDSKSFNAAAFGKYVDRIPNVTKTELAKSGAVGSNENDGVQSTAELVNMVYAAAQDARGSFSQMADVVARFGNNAKDAFSSSEEVVAFADLIQKQMTIAGASTQEAANAELQLSQALGSGVLRGDELNSIFEQAPNLIQNIADYLDVPIGQIREMAADGELSADIVKTAIFSAADDINSKFESMPMTWSQIWQLMQNTALIAFQPVLQNLNDLANSDVLQASIQNAIGAISALANILLDVFDSGAQHRWWLRLHAGVQGRRADLHRHHHQGLVYRDVPRQGIRHRWYGVWLHHVRYTHGQIQCGPGHQRQLHEFGREERAIQLWLHRYRYRRRYPDRYRKAGRQDNHHPHRCCQRHGPDL